MLTPVPPSSPSARPTDFDFLKVIGKGNYGKVSDPWAWKAWVSSSLASSAPCCYLHMQRGSLQPAESWAQGRGWRPALPSRNTKPGGVVTTGSAFVFLLRSYWPSTSPTGCSTQWRCYRKSPSYTKHVGHVLIAQMRWKGCFFSLLRGCSTYLQWQLLVFCLLL